MCKCEEITLLVCSSSDRFELNVDPHKQHTYFASLCTSICFRRSALLKNLFGHFEQATGLYPECLIVWLRSVPIILNPLPHVEQRCANWYRNMKFNQSVSIVNKCFSNQSTYVFHPNAWPNVLSMNLPIEMLANTYSKCMVFHFQFFDAAEHGDNPKEIPSEIALNNLDIYVNYDIQYDIPNVLADFWLFETIQYNNRTGHFDLCINAVHNASLKNALNKLYT